MLDQVLTPLPKVFQKMQQKDQKQILWASNKFKHDVDSEVENFQILFNFLRNIADGRPEEESFAEGGSDSEGPPNNETEGKTESEGRKKCETESDADSDGTEGHHNIFHPKLLLDLRNRHRLEL